MSTRANIRLITFCIFLILTMLVVSSVLIFSAGQQDIQSLISIEFTAEKVKLNYANYDGTTVTPGNCDIVLNSDKTKFKIVGPTPIIEGSTSTQSSGPTGKVSSIDDLTNSSGAEFYYFCTNSAVIGSTGYTDPGMIYYTSTADSTLESWYDLPSSQINLYSCFMVPNYTSEVVYSGSDTQIVISNKVVNIPYEAFYQKSITDVVIPQSVKNIGYGASAASYGAFESCLSLKKLFIPNSVTSIENYTFYGSSGLTNITIGNGVTSIGNNAFNKCSGLTSITLPDSMTSIGSNTFSECSKLTSVTIGSGVTSIGNSAFENCTGLTSITIPNSVTSIESDAFRGCSGLTSVTIGSGVTSIGDAFDSCSGLTSITVSENNITYRSSGNCLIKKSDNSLILGCKTSVIPNSVTSIGEYAFDNCSGLTSITIPKSVTSIGDFAFSRCSSLTSITIPDSVMSIGGYAFSNCRGLTNITIGNSVTSIWGYAFENCSGLTSITIPDSVTTIGNSVFAGCGKLTSVTFADTSKTWTAEAENGVNNNVSVVDPAQNATYLKSTYLDYVWSKNS